MGLGVKFFSLEYLRRMHGHGEKRHGFLRIHRAPRLFLDLTAGAVGL